MAEFKNESFEKELDGKLWRAVFVPKKSICRRVSCPGLEDTTKVNVDEQLAVEVVRLGWDEWVMLLWWVYVSVR